MSTQFNKEIDPKLNISLQGMESDLLELARNEKKASLKSILATVNMYRNNSPMNPASLREAARNYRGQAQIYSQSFISKKPCRALIEQYELTAKACEDIASFLEKQ